LHKLKINFVNWKFFLSDERIIKNDNLRNDEFLKKNFFSKIIFKKKNFIYYKKKIISYKSLKEYKKKLKVKFFHLSILGFGNDGHVASIFSNPYKQDHSCYLIENSSVYPHKRVTMSLKLLNKSREIMLIAYRRNKKEMIKKILLKKKDLIVTKLKPQDKLYLFTYP
jgi:6-phosphogluconolactonase/glucosamine-6-phosphate isomerase/deaminase